MFGAERDGVFRPRHLAYAGPGAPNSASLRRIRSLSCAKINALGGGCTLTPSATRVSRCSVGTCSWSKVSALEPVAAVPQCIEVVMMTEDDVGTDLRGRLVRARCQHSKRLAELDGGLVSHSCELTAADHRHHGHGCFCRSRGGWAGGDLRGIVVAGHGSLCCHVPRSPVHSAFPICDSADESAANWW